VIIGDSEFEQGPDGLKPYPSFRVSAEKYFGLLNTLRPFEGNCVLVPSEGGGVRKTDVEKAVRNAAELAAGGDDLLLVVYVGHGNAWPDYHDNLVHLAVHESREGWPSGWLEYGALLHAMKPKREGLRIIIADCCYSNILHSMGPGEENVSGRAFALREQDRGTAVFTALDPSGRQVIANPIACDRLDEQWQGCTHFSGHLLQVLARGSRFADDMLSLGDVREAVRNSMSRCENHPRGGLILLGPTDSTPFVENKLPASVLREPRALISESDWVAALQSGRGLALDRLMADPRLAARVSLALWDTAEGRENAGRIDRLAIEDYAADLDKYGAYWFIRDGLASDV
jgi:hypothetical protein